MTDLSAARADDFEYLSLRAETHADLTRLLNDAASDCWEPVGYSIWSLGTGLGTSVERGTHFVILRRDTVYFETRLREVAQNLVSNDFETEEDRESAKRFVHRAREHGYDA